jgi:hypothetical protein
MGLIFTNKILNYGMTLMYQLKDNKMVHQGQFRASHVQQDAAIQYY